MILVLAQQEAAEPTTDLTVPVAVIVACAAIIAVTLLIQLVRRRRAGTPAGEPVGSAEPGSGSQ